MSRTGAKHPTLRDVAALAGVSHQTVSRVINNVPGVLDETRERVQAAVSRLGYRPHAIARTLARGRTNMLACLAPNLTDFTYASNMEGAEAMLREQGYFLLAAAFRDETQFVQLTEEFVLHRRVDGLLVISPFTDVPYRILPDDFPLVLMGGASRSDVRHMVYLDNRLGARTATEHLLALGHRRIAQITGPLAEDCSQERAAGFRAALARAGFVAGPGLSVEGDWSASSGDAGLRQLLGRDPAITAVVAQNDRMAVGVIRAAHDLGREVPGDLSVVGFDDMPLASYFDPPLTTMRQDTFAIGRACAALLMDILDGPGAPPRSVRLEAELLVRQSTAPPRSA